MNKLNFLQGLAVAGITATTIATAPAQASTLGWSNGTSDFFSQVEPIEGNNFQVIFSPDVTQDPPDNGIGAASMDNVDGIFAPPFQGAPPIYLQSIEEVVANFTYEGDGPGPGEFIYALDGDAVFEFVGVPVEAGADNPGRDGNAIVTVLDDTKFIGFFDNGAVEFALAPASLQPSAQRMVPGGINFTNAEGELEMFLDDGFEFEDGSLPAGGEYLAEVEYTAKTPEPATILGLLAVSGLGLGLKRKKQS